MTAVELRDVFRVYEGAEGTAAALQGVSLAIDEGEIVGVVGPSGSGKSTLLRIIAALERPSTGRITIFGSPVDTWSRVRRARFRAGELGYLDQHYWRALDPHQPVRDLVAQHLALDGVPARERRRRAHALLERVGLADRAFARRGELSGGEQQRVALAASLVHSPRILLADEPTGELDEAGSRAAFDLLATLTRERRATAVVVSHDAGVARIADRVLQIRDGRLSSIRSAGEEVLVVGRGGWVQLPDDLRAAARIGSRARARKTGVGILLTPGDDRGPPPDHAARSDAALLRRFGDVAGVTVDRVTKTLGDPPQQTRVLQDFSAFFPGATVSCVTGPSGSGKTTLLRVVAGLDVADEGTAHVAGVEITSLPRDARARMRRTRIAYVSQQRGLNPLLTALENVELALALRGFATADAPGEAARALAAVGLSERAHHRVARLSAGERQRVALARALARPRPVVLADEPTARLDAANAAAVAALLAAYAMEHDATVICATHDDVVAAAAGKRIELRR